MLKEMRHNNPPTTDITTYKNTGSTKDHWITTFSKQNMESLCTYSIFFKSSSFTYPYIAGGYNLLKL